MSFKQGASRTFLTVEHSLMSDLPLWASRDRNPSLIHQLTVTVHYMVKILSVSSCLKCLFAAILDGYLNHTQNDFLEKTDTALLRYLSSGLFKCDGILFEGR